ncbi:hypothetical protein F511_42489 [Dorcoceras hygrometricum]|uniref:Uncharacterized protein n=1 Tax=Dorcoceras hygrometricum TaxID=472368 RepID=A0A2Z7ATC9_9LAMI|nr:hypothetical protein F511_42489 [Dorcoceras hygrometricum]
MTKSDPTSYLVAAKLAEVPDDESLSLEALLRALRAKSFPPSVTPKEPITNIRCSQGIQIGGVNWITRSLPKIAPEDKGKRFLVEIPKGNPVKETINLIFAVLEFFVKIRDSVFVGTKRSNQAKRFDKIVQQQLEADVQKQGSTRKRHVLVTVTHVGISSKSSLCICWFIDVSTGFDDVGATSSFW